MKAKARQVQTRNKAELLIIGAANFWSNISRDAVNPLSLEVFKTRFAVDTSCIWISKCNPVPPGSGPWKTGNVKVC